MIGAQQPTIFDATKLGVWVSSRQDGNMKYEQGPDAGKNLVAFAAANGIAQNQLMVMYVNDSASWDTIHDITPTEASLGALTPEARIHTDAMVTTTPRVAIVLPIADCCPVVLHDPVTQTLAVVHLGWRSSDADLATKTIHHMQQGYDCQPRNIRAYMGPCIYPESYVFSDRPGQADKPQWQGFVSQHADGWHIDIPGYNQDRFLKTGLLPAHIQQADVDTVTSQDYFSHYRAAQTGVAVTEGRFVVTAMLR